jgi:hypothetical protein
VSIQTDGHADLLLLLVLCRTVHCVEKLCLLQLCLWCVLPTTVTAVNFSLSAVVCVSVWALWRCKWRLVRPLYMYIAQR